MSAPITIDLEITSPAAVALEITAPTVDVSPDSEGAQVVVVAVPGSTGPPGPPGDGTGVFGETPFGTQDGVNTAFTLADTPRSASVAVYRNGLRERLGVGFSVSGSTITFSTAPMGSDEIAVDYVMEG